MNISETIVDPLKSPSVKREKEFKTQLLKWIGNKQKFAPEIISFFPNEYKTYFEPFLGSGGVLGTLSPNLGVGSDIFKPLIEIWQTLSSNPEELKLWYQSRYEQIDILGKKEAYVKFLDQYNKNPNGADLVFILRTCYGGVVRFRKSDKFMSTPCGVHNPISPESFNKRVDLWHARTKNVNFIHSDYADVMDLAKSGDLIYCDPPYVDSQAILYGAQDFSISQLMEKISECKSRGVFVALSIDGTKRSGDFLCDVPIPTGLFEREVFINVGRSMLKRFQMDGQTLENFIVKDRLLLTY